MYRSTLFTCKVAIGLDLDLGDVGPIALTLKTKSSCHQNLISDGTV